MEKSKKGMRKREKCSHRDDQKQFARGLARSILGRERKDTLCVNSFGFFLRGSLSTVVGLSYLSDALPFISVFIDSLFVLRKKSRSIARTSMLKAEDFSTCHELWNHISSDGSWLKDRALKRIVRVDLILKSILIIIFLYGQWHFICFRDNYVERIFKENYFRENIII